MTEQTNMAKCWKCKGTGRFFTSRGVDFGECFKCRGTGKLPSAANNQQAAATKAAMQFPKLADLAFKRNIRLHLSTGKFVATQSGGVFFAAKTYGDGLHGKLTEDGQFRPYKSFTSGMLTELEKIEAEGIEAVKSIGLLTGACCVCGRTLTNEDSIAGGIGPICASKIGGW